MKPLLCLVALLVSLAGPAAGQDEEAAPKLTLEVVPQDVELDVFDQLQLEVRVLDESGAEVDVDKVDGVRLVYFSRDREIADFSPPGVITAKGPGEGTVVVRAAGLGGPGASVKIAVRVAFPPLDRIEIRDVPEVLYTGTRASVSAMLVDKAGLERAEVPVQMALGSSGAATVDSLGHLTGVAAGRCELFAEVEGLRAQAAFEVVENPIRRIELTAPTERAQTGDVLQFEAIGRDEAGKPVEGVPIHFSFEAHPDDTLGQAATGQVEQDGRFVAEAPGVYTVVASSGGATARASVRAEPRDVQREVEFIGHGEVLDVHTSDLWVWEGVDKRDYAVTGTWGADGDALFWDVTDPADIQRIANVRVDARTVNDVKVSADGRICVLSREGASNRKNGIVILDVVDPRNPKILSTFTDELTGGVHNLFIYEDHVYALSAARRYDIINIEDPAQPYRVGSFELETPNHSIHDVWVENGIAYSSNWRDGVVMVDVGGGGMGGSPSNPVQMGSYAYPSGWNHAAFPYRDPETDKFYIVAGDEAFPFGLYTSERPTYPRGWIHFIDFSDRENPEEVARYQVPEAGTHNLWIEDDLLYVGYYNGGLRVVDISGDLLGDLYRQGREVGWFLPTHHEGKVPNAPMTWGPQPHKGHIFFSDWNSGLWSVRLKPEVEE
ncbi:MAG: hypothetical protein AAF682_00950 [Planctomycetota bacterium]